MKIKRRRIKACKKKTSIMHVKYRSRVTVCHHEAEPHDAKVTFRTDLSIHPRHSCEILIILLYQWMYFVMLLLWALFLPGTLVGILNLIVSIHRPSVFMFIIPRHFKKCGILCYTLRKKKLHSSVRPSIRLSPLSFRALT